MLALGPSWLDPETILRNLGDFAFIAAVFIVFAECGLLIGFFLPGDSLLFVVGLLIAQGFITVNLGMAVLVLIIAAILGNITGYWIGRKAGPRLFRRPDSRLFKQEYVEKTHAFFEKYGARAILLARFVPIVRTFITAIAGVGQMDPRRYFAYSAVGGVLWAGGVTVLGYFLGNVGFIKDNLEIVAIVIVGISVIPMIVEYWRHRAEAKRSAG